MIIEFRPFILLTCLSICSLYEISYSQTGSITGVVSDADNGEELIGATVVIEGNQSGTVTDIDGKFSLNNIVGGAYALKISYVGYESKKISGVQVLSSEVTNIAISLSVAKANTLSEVVVTAEVKKETINSMLTVRKNSGSIADFISADIIKKSPDKNTSDVLKRVSGVTVQDNKFVVVRGMNDRYNEAMLNGFPLPSSEPDRKTFAFDIFPAAVVDNITIVKGANPDMPGDFSGGLVQINTKDIPDKNFIGLKAGANYNSISTFKPYYTYAGGKTDWLGIDDGTRALPDGFPSHDEFLQLGADDVIKAAQLMPNNWTYNKENSSPLNPSFELAGGFRTGKQATPSLGGILGITYNSTRKFSPIDRYDYYGLSDAVSDTIYKYRDSSYNRNILASAIADFTFKLNPNNKLFFNNIYSINSNDQTVIRTGYSFSQSYFIKANSYYFNSNQILNDQFGGDHYVSKIKLRIRWQGNYTRLKRDEPDYRRNLYETDDTTSAWFSPVTFGTSITSVGAGLRYYGNIDDKSYGGTLDLSMPFQLFHNSQSVKIGALYYNDSRVRDVRTFSVGIADPNNFNFNYYYATQDTIFSPEHFDNSTGFTLIEDKLATNYYDGSQENIVGYAMLDNRFTHWIRLVWGLRFENFHYILNTFGQNFEPLLIDTVYADALPSANLILSPLKDANLRFSFYKAIARPSYRELANALFYDFLENITYYGNPKLVETHIANFDVRWEQYFAGAQYYSITGFYKTFENAIEQNLYFPGSDSRSVQFVNVPKANNVGVELEGRKNFDFIGKGFENLSAYLNFTYLKSKVFVKGATSDTSANRPLQGQSPLVFNASLQYVYPKINLGVSLLFNSIGHRLYLVGSVTDEAVWQKVHPTLDLKITKSFLKNGLVEVTWGDILHGDDIQYQDLNDNQTYEEVGEGNYSSSDRLIALQRFGYTFSLAVRYQF